MQSVGRQHAIGSRRISCDEKCLISTNACALASMILCSFLASIYSAILCVHTIECKECNDCDKYELITNEKGDIRKWAATVRIDNMSKLRKYLKLKTEPKRKKQLNREQRINGQHRKIDLKSMMSTAQVLNAIKIAKVNVHET